MPVKLLDLITSQMEGKHSLKVSKECWIYFVPLYFLFSKEHSRRLVSKSKCHIPFSKQEPEYLST